ncbi:MAG TPA: aldehyde dehydrogenase family protein, partial [Candidatus Dormibacteraeota bacterium]|nr:aldehyde dehydrogenase family protein [Candidatus Dormibacteraeota bacterium]
MIIEGERVGAVSGETYQVKDPATGEVVDEVPKGGPEDVDRAARAAEKAQRTWGRLSGAERRRILHRAAEHMLSKVDEIAPILTREQGKTLLESRIEARRFGENIAWYGDLADKVHGEYVSLPDTGAFGLVLRRP